MTKQTVMIAIAAAVIGFIGGFIFTNALNRREMTTRMPPVEQQAAPPLANTNSAAANTLTPEEIKARIETADQNPGDFNFQKSLGLSLYRYASLKQDPSLLPDAIRIMQRALDLDSADRDLQIGLGNAHFDVGYFNKDNASFERARVYYDNALARVPSDTDVRTDVALTYFLQTPPDLESAVKEFEKGLGFNPKHERSLQFLVQTHVKRNDAAKANEALERLKAANSANPAIGELTSMIAAGPESVK